MTFSPRRNVLALGVLGWLTALSASGDGPGLGNLTYAPHEHLATLATFTAANAAPAGHGFVTMHNGYLAVIYSNDGGGGNGSGGFTFYNVSNPRSPAVVFTTQNNSPYTTPSSPNYAGDIREAHGFSFWNDVACLPSNRGQGTGLQFWDWSNVTAPTRLSRINLPGLTGGDYSPTAWWVFWQGGRYAYVAGTSAGIFIVDASDPANPVLVDRGNGLPNPIPTSQTGGFRVNTLFVVGNTMVISASDANGLATLDVSDPLNPVLLDTVSPGTGLYSIMVNGNRVLGAHDPARIWDISNPANITPIGSGPNVADKGGYGAFQDGVFHYGSSSAYVKLDISSLPFTVLAMNAPTGFTNPDWDFATPLGNLVFQGNDHSGSALIVHQTWPDTNGPLVNMVVPRPNATNQALTSRVGLTFTDQLDQRTLNTNTCIIRPIGGAALPGRYSHQTGIVNFWPDQPLLPNTTYEIAVPAGGIQDLVGNAISLSFTSRFSTVVTEIPLSVSAFAAPPATNGQTVNLTASGLGAGTLQYAWNFGDGSPLTAFSPSSNAAHLFAQPGHYSVVVTVTNGQGGSSSASFIQTIHRPLTAIQPAASGTIIYDAQSNRVWNVNADANTVAIINGTNFAKLFEQPVGRNPRTLAQAPDGTIWVVNQDDATISVLNRANGTLAQTIALPRASRPYGIAFAPDGSAAYVTLQGTGRLLKLDPAARTVISHLAIGPTPRGLAISGDSQRIFVTRFISPDANGVVTEVDAATFTIARTIPLALDPGPDLEDSGRGLPNYLSSITISPDGLRAWLPSKKDNIQRGQYRDGQPLDFESSVRTIVSQIDLATNAEVLSARRDLNDRDMAFAARFSPLGDYVFVAVQGANAIDVLDAYSGERITALEETGRAPQGLISSPDGHRLFVNNFMSRTVRVFDVAGIVNATNNIAPVLATIPTVANEPLPPQVLLGKQIFYNAEDPRMNRDNYLSCASCHQDGGHDGRVWDFTDRGEGLRNTVALVGRADGGQGRVHWSGNFDEIQDFEHDIRSAFGGDGFLSDAQFNAGTRNQPLGDRKGGLSPELDALAAYVSSLTNVPPSPFRNADGSLTADGLAGKAIFASLNCASCHTGNQFTDSSAEVLHDVGTIKPGSGQRLGQPLTGLDTPTLKGIWDTAPYFHDGSAATLAEVLAGPGGHHAAFTAALNETQKQQLIAYLLQIDEAEIVNVPPIATLLSPTNNAVFIPPTNLVLTATASDADGIRRVEFFANGIWIGQATNEPFALTWSNAPVGIHELTARATDNLGDFTTTTPVNVTVDPAALALRWNSTSSAAWDIGASANWYNPLLGGNDVFTSGADVLFTDTPGVVTNVTIGAGVAVQPATMRVNASVHEFMVSGAGKISGAASLTKLGGSRFTLSPSNDFTGTVTVAGGTLRVGHNRALGTADGETIVQSGATLDVGSPGATANSVNLGPEVVFVSGSGVGGLGAIINSSGTGQQNALQRVTLTGDTVIGGTARWDIRAGSGAFLSTGGQTFNLTKVGPNQVNLVNTFVDPNLAAIAVQAGQFGIEGNINALGNPTAPLTVFGGATVRFTSWANVLRKALVLHEGAIVFNTSGNNTFGGTISLQGSNVFNIAGTALTLTNVISGAGTLAKVTGASPLVLTAPNAFSGDTWIASGVLRLTGNGSVGNSGRITVLTTLDVSGRTDGTLHLNGGQTLQGTGVVTGSLLAKAGAMVSPGGNGIGTLTVTNFVTLGGTTFMEVNQAASTQDRLEVGPFLNYFGTLVVTNLSATPLVSGDSFKIFEAQNYSGAFASILPAIPALHLAWDPSTLTTDGTLRVITAPTPQPEISSVTWTGNDLTLNGTNGVPGWTYYVLTSTNIALPVGNWTRITTNAFSAAGTFAFSHAAANALQQFYRLQLAP